MQVGIVTIKRIEKAGGLNLGTLIFLLWELDKLHNLDAVLFELNLRNFHEDYEGRKGSSRHR